MSTEIYSPKTQQQIYDAMKRWLIGEDSKLNNFNEGSRLAIILEAFSMVLAETNNDYYQALKVAIPTSVYNAFDFERKAGSQASGKLVFSRATSASEDYTIPIGTIMLLNGIRFETTQLGYILTGNTDSSQLDAICSEIGVDGNISIGAIATLTGQGSFLNQPEGIESCTNPTAFAGGTEEESDSDRISRFNNFILSLARATENGLINAALSVEGILSATVVESYPAAGWCTVFADDGTGSLTSTQITNISKVINGDPSDRSNYPGYRAAGIQVRVSAPTVVSVDFTLEIKILSGSVADPADLELAAENALSVYVNTLRLGMDVILSEVTKAIKNASSDIYDIDYTTPVANTTINSTQLARTGTISISSSYVSV